MKKTPLKRKTRLSPISKRRAKFRFVPPDVLKRVKERSGGMCERLLGCKNDKGIIWGASKCRYEAMSQPHHILGRAQGGEHRIDNLVYLCASCHRWVHDHPQDAIREGLMKPYKNYIHGSLED